LHDVALHDVSLHDVALHDVALHDVSWSFDFTMEPVVGPGGTVSGIVAPGWEPLRTAFETNFANNRELGAQLVVCVSPS
jgi:hypothetical protein